MTPETGCTVPEIYHLTVSCIWFRINTAPDVMRMRDPVFTHSPGAYLSPDGGGMRLTDSEGHPVTTPHDTHATKAAAVKRSRAKSTASPQHTRRTGKASARKADAPRTDVYQLVTDRIVLALENGTPPWRKPWRCAQDGHSSGMPVNALTGRAYSGINVLLLWAAAEEQGFASDRWLTYNQAKEAGGQVRKGETASLAVVYKDWACSFHPDHRTGRTTGPRLTR